jgi:hypothetical protein
MIRITQWLCSRRHCSVALAWDSETESEQEIISKGEAVYSSGAVNRWCGICKESLKPETRDTPFRSIEDALPTLQKLQEANLATREMIERISKTNRN